MPDRCYGIVRIENENISIRAFGTEARLFDSKEKGDSITVERHISYWDPDTTYKVIG